MASWQTTTKHEPSAINNGNQYTRDDVVPIEQLNAITENSFYAVEKSEEALTKANSAFENNGTVVSVGDRPVTSLSFYSDPQTQINSKANQNDLNAINSVLSSLSENKAERDLSNVTYPEIVADGVPRTGAGDRVVESRIYSDGLTWYRLWASGWKECGGIINFGLTTGSVSGEKISLITLPIAFSNNKYFVQHNYIYPSTTDGNIQMEGGHGLVSYNYTPASFKCYQVFGASGGEAWWNRPVSWYACGY